MKNDNRNGQEPPFGPEAPNAWLRQRMAPGQAEVERLVHLAVVGPVIDEADGSSDAGPPGG